MMKPLMIAALLCIITCPISGYAGYNMAPDKKLHLGAGIVIGAGSYYICPAFEQFILDDSFIPPLAWSIGMSSLAGAGKEIIYDDIMGRGNPDIYDFYYTAAGGVISGVTLLLIESMLDLTDENLSIEADPVNERILISYSHCF